VAALDHMELATPSWVLSDPRDRIRVWDRQALVLIETGLYKKTTLAHMRGFVFYADFNVRLNRGENERSDRFFVQPGVSVWRAVGESAR